MPSRKRSNPVRQNKSAELGLKMQAVIDSQSRERILVGDVMSIVVQAGQIFRETSNDDWGIDGEIEFKTGGAKPEASGNAHTSSSSRATGTCECECDTKEIFAVDERHVRYWMSQPCPVFLVIGSSERVIRWMEVSSYLKKKRVSLPVCPAKSSSMASLSM